MKLRRYAVTVMDHWTAMRTFWTYRGALRFYRRHQSCAHLFEWQQGLWIEILL